jgi:hypothetical protein
MRRVGGDHSSAKHESLRLHAGEVTLSTDEDGSRGPAQTGGLPQLQLIGLLVGVFSSREILHAPVTNCSFGFVIRLRNVRT